MNLQGNYNYLSEGGTFMKLKKILLTFAIAVGVVSAPITALAAHTHNWGADQYYGFTTEMPSPFDDWDKCVTNHAYNYHQCLTCGQTEIFEVATVQLKHNFSGGICLNCGKGYAKQVE